MLEAEPRRRLAQVLLHSAADQKQNLIDPAVMHQRQAEQHHWLQTLLAASTRKFTNYCVYALQDACCVFMYAAGPNQLMCSLCKLNSTYITKYQKAESVDRVQVLNQQGAASCHADITHGTAVTDFCACKATFYVEQLHV